MLEAIKARIRLWLAKIRNLRQEKFLENCPEDLSVNIKLVESKLELNLGNSDSFQRIRIDIGLSNHAPYSAFWSQNYPDTFVVGIEPNAHNAYQILKKGIWSKSHGKPYIRRKHRENFHLIQCAIDNVDEIQLSDFYMMNGDPGTSSLLEPTPQLTAIAGYSVRDKAQVVTVPLSLILDAYLEKFKMIDVLKTDTQGKDLEVLKSAGRNLEKVAVIIAELESYGQYVGAADRKAIIKYLSSKNFVYRPDMMPDQIEDGVFVNQMLIHDEKTLSKFV